VLKHLTDLAVDVAALLFWLVAAALALAAWAFALSLPFAALWAAFRCWGRVFGS
jgi:hypothetical protein